MSSTVLTPDKVVTPSTDDTEKDEDYTGWFCISTDPFKCMCGEFVANFATVAHMILVWEEKDDPALLELAQAKLLAELNPKVVEYQTIFGKCIPFWVWKSDPSIQAHYGRG